MGDARRWLWAGIAVGCGLAIAFSPAARRHLIDGLYFGLNEIPVWQRAVNPSEQAYLISDVTPAEEHLFSHWLALATANTGQARKEEDAELVRERVRRLEELLERFPRRVSLYAHLGRYYAAAVSLKAPKGREQDPNWQVRPDDWERLRDLMREGSKKQPNNAYFLQMLAVAYVGMNNMERALQQWEAAAEKTIWKDYAEEEIFAQWQLLESRYGERGARLRFPAIAMLRLPHPALIGETAQKLSEHVSKEGTVRDQVRLRLLNARNGALIRDQAKQVVAGLAGIEIVEAAIQWGDPEGRTPSPRRVEERRAAFRKVLRQVFPSPLAAEEDKFVVRQARKNDGYRAQIPSVAAWEFSGWNTVSGGPELWTGWLFRSIATSALVDGSFGMLVRFTLAWAFAVSIVTLASRWRLALPERLRGALAVFFGLSTGLLAYIGSQSWTVGAWYSLLIGTFAYLSADSSERRGATPSGMEYLVWTRAHTAWAWLVVLVLFVAGLFGFVFRYADFPGAHLALTGVRPPAPKLTPYQWSLIGWFAVSLPFLVSMVWAIRARTALIPAAFEGFARLAVLGMALSAVVFLLSLPYSIVRDREDVTRLELIAKNEPNYYRRAAATVSPRYHERSNMNEISVPEGVTER